MKHLIVYAHPNTSSANHHLKETAAAAIRRAGHEVEIRDLYAIGFDPVLSLQDMQGQMKGENEENIVREQEYIRRADAVTFIYPVWWTGMPAIMKGYVDRVMTYGFAYRYDQGVQQGLLRGKAAYIFNTHGKSHEEYRASGMDNALRLTSDAGIYRYCGFDVKQHLFFDRADRATAEVLAVWARDVEAAYSAC
ncbi:NAD(P)H-dependent oxidoreductase [Chitinophaga sp. GCM10012297]|uniref:NAD(P)H-dependent oxidoreductase n=1 Tax=Chitinophaga chungangae TaxID=2821488 RepID=A0ABS3YAU8_9BACT|nr:NAD(P)H-dependent oxidoreductase [Chitinophaga chungangae]MBO9151800.1 NAD(P)H-dependent oxidoreductase [Chitinophaga chungangae]